MYMKQSINGTLYIISMLHTLTLLAMEGSHHESICGNCGICCVMNKDRHVSRHRAFYDLPEGEREAAQDRWITLLRAWPKFSGNELHPVPHPEGGCPSLAYIYLPKWKGKYGEDRRELAGFIASNWHNPLIV